MKKFLSVLLLAAAFAAGAAEKQSSDDVEARLKAARERLAEAAREVAELSGQLASPVMDKLMVLGQEPPRSIIGVQLDSESGKEGVRVVEVSPGGAAAEAGVRSGDVIVSVNGEKIQSSRSAREVAKRLRDLDPKSKVKLGVLREGQPKDFELTTRPAGVGVNRWFRSYPGMPAPPPGLSPDMPTHSFAFRLDDEVAGMELATLTPSLGKYFGTDKGVLVVRAPDRASFKLEDGDVILSIGGREPTSGSHATRILRSYQPGEKIELKLMRQRKPMSLVVTLPNLSKDVMYFNERFDIPDFDSSTVVHMDEDQT